jgi:hypothetical protein
MAQKPERPRSMADDIIGVIREGTKKWTRTVKAEERSPASRSYRYSRMTRERGISVKDAAAQVMEAAYLKASGNEDGTGSKWANARQVMYAARDHIQTATGKPLNDDYFTQTVLPDFISDNPGLTAGWNINYDVRGHFREPHGGRIVGLGTREVRTYLAGLRDPKLVDALFARAMVETCGPSGSFGALVFVEKEGFDEQIREARIADRFDVATMSSKGMSVTAARLLADHVCHKYNIPLLLLTDYDKAAFSIAGTLQRDTRRYEFQNDIKVIPLGLSLTDVEAMGLASEYQYHRKGSKAALIANLRKNGATEADIEFTFRDFDAMRSTRRVELNAMTSPQFIAFVERKLTEHGLKKIVPDKHQLADAYRLFVRSDAAKQIVRRELKKLDGDTAVQVPRDLDKQVREHLAQRPADRWDEAVRQIAAMNRKRAPR